MLTDTQPDAMLRPVLLSMSQIAEFAGVARPVVTTWRRRHRDFPAPVTDTDPDAAAGRLPAAFPGRGALFNGAEIARWLVETGRMRQEDARADLAVHSVTSLAGLITGTEVIDAVTSLIALRALSGDEPLSSSPGTGAFAIPAGLARHLRARAERVDPHDLLLRREVERLGAAELEHREEGEGALSLVRLVDDLIEACWGCAPAFERIMSARFRLGADELNADAIDALVARLIAALSGAREHADREGYVTVADPVAGAGDLLYAVGTVVGDDADVVWQGAESSERLARIARRRVAVREEGLSESRIAVGDWQQQAAAEPPPGRHRPDVTVCRLPYRPAEHRSAQDAIGFVAALAARLEVWQTAVVLGPADAFVESLRRDPRADRMRAELLATGKVEAVIALPGGALPFRPAYETALMVLAPAANTSPAVRGRVLLADVSGSALTPETIDALVSDVVTWRRTDLGEHTRSWQLARLTPVADLLRPGAALRPKPRHDITAHRRIPATVARITELEVELHQRAQQPPPPVRSRLGRRDGQAPQRTTLGALVTSGDLALVPGRRIDPVHVTALGNHAVIGAAEASGQARPGARRIALDVLAAEYPRLTLTEPGDVIVTLTPILGALVDEEGASVVEFPARVLRLTGEVRRRVLTPHTLAGLLLAAGRDAQRATGAVRASRRLEAYEIPILTATETQALDGLIRAMNEREMRLRAELETLRELGNLAVGGIADGTLAFTTPPTT